MKTKKLLTIDEVIKSRTSVYNKMIAIYMTMQNETDETERARLRAAALSLFKLWQHKQSFNNKKKKKMGQQIDQMHEMHGTKPQPGKPLVERIPVEESPFTLLKTEEEGYNTYQITMGRYIISQKYYTEDQALKAIQERDYNLLLNIITAMIKEQNN